MVHIYIELVHHANCGTVQYKNLKSEKIIIYTSESYQFEKMYDNMAFIYIYENMSAALAI